METDLRRQAQERVDRIGRFRAELAELEREGGLVLAAEQRARLETHLEGVLARLRRDFGADITESARRISWGLRVVSVLGVAALGAALVLFLHRVWGHLPAAVQVVVLAGVPLALLGAAEEAFRRRVDRFQVGLLAVSGAVVFALALDALRSVLNIGESPQVWLAVSAFAVLAAHAYGLRLLLAAGLAVGCVYTAAMATATEGAAWDAWGLRGQYLLPAATVLYSVPWWTGRWGGHGELGRVYRWCGAAMGLLGLLLVSVVGHLCCGGLEAGAVRAGWQLAGLALSAGIIAHGIRGGWGGLVNVGAVGFVVFLFVRLHAWWWDWMPKYLFFLVVGLIAAGLGYGFWRLRRRIAEGGAT